MLVDAAFQRLRDANPVPHPAALRERPIDASVFLVATQQRSREMQTKHEPIQTETAPPRRRRNWIPAVVAAVVVMILAGASVVVFTGDTEPDVAGGPASPVEIATAFIEARDAWDGEAARALVADDALIDGFVATADEYLTQDEFERATGWRFMQPDCAETVAGPPADVFCTYTMENAWSRARGVGPFPNSKFWFTIADGKIQQLTHLFEISEFSPQVWDVVRKWVRDTHPEDLDVLYTPEFDAPIRTPEAIALWEQYTKEFVASMEAEAGTP